VLRQRQRLGMRSRSYIHPVRAYRERHGLSLEQLGARCKPPLNKSVIYRIEIGERKPNFDQIVSLVEACGYEFTTDQLIQATPRQIA
jgi:ribosome-binding protein aMBF1 (putative translation factor)